MANLHPMTSYCPHCRQKTLRLQSRDGWGFERSAISVVASLLLDLGGWIPWQQKEQRWLRNNRRRVYPYEEIPGRKAPKAAGDGGSGERRSSSKK
jgi:hypothetical protein